MRCCAECVRMLSRHCAPNPAQDGVCSVYDCCTSSKLSDADPVAEGDGRSLCQVAPRLQDPRSRVGIAVAHSLHQYCQQVVLAP